MPVSNLKVHGALLVVALIYGATYSIAKVVMPNWIEPFAFILIRVTAGATVFMIVWRFTAFEKIRSKKDYFRLLLCGIFGVAANQLFFFKGLSLTTTISASVLMVSNPVIVIILSYFFLKKKITWQNLLGIFLGSVGAIMLISRGEMSLESKSFVGDFFILLNSFSFAIYLILVKPLMNKYNALTVIGWVFLFGALFVIPFGMEEILRVEWGQIPAFVWLSITFVVLFTTIVAYFLNVWSLKFVNPTVVSYYIYLQPLFATLIALLFLKENHGPEMILFALMIFAGVYLVGKKSVK